MNPIKVAAIVGLLVCGAPAVTVQHINPGPDDIFLSCASAVLGKPVLSSGWGLWRSASPTDLRCPLASKEALIQELARYDLKLKDAGDYFFILPVWFANGGDSAYFDTDNFRFVRSVHNVDGGISGSRQLTTDELNALSGVIFAQARTTPVVPSEGPSKINEKDGVITTTIHLQLDAHQLRPGVESVIGVLGQAYTDHRLIYGEIIDGKYRMLWDSPLVGGRDFGLGYKDVNGDGELEIVVMFDVYQFGQALVVFDRHGNELTRQNCDGYFGLDSPEGNACPIEGDSVLFRPGKDSAFDIIALNEEKSGLPPETRYVLRNDHYEFLSPTRPNCKRWPSLPACIKQQ